MKEGCGFILQIDAVRTDMVAVLADPHGALNHQSTSHRRLSNFLFRSIFAWYETKNFWLNETDNQIDL
jgi:hypothetical protein